MKKKKKLRTRKQRAIRQVLWALLALLVACELCNVGRLLPIQAIWDSEERYGVGYMDLDTVTWMHVPETHLTHLRCLRVNEKVTFLGGTYLTVMGWVENFGIALDCTGEDPIYAARHDMYRREKEHSSLWIVFGRVDDPAVTDLQVCIRQQAAWDENGDPTAWEDLGIFTVEADEWFTQAGRRYFLVKRPEVDFGEDVYPQYFIRGLDVAGETVADMEIQRWTSTSFG